MRGHKQGPGLDPIVKLKNYNVGFPIDDMHPEGRLDVMLADKALQIFSSSSIRYLIF